MTDSSAPAPSALGAAWLRGLFSCAALSLVLSGTLSEAQETAGMGEQALGAPRGVLRVTIAPSFETFDSRFLPNGETEPLGARLTTPALGASVFPSVFESSEAVLALAGGSSFDGSLGDSRVRASTSINTIRFGAELGVADRLTLVATVPVVRTFTEFQMELNGAAGNLGINPALLDADVAAFHQTALDAQAAAAGALGALIADCTTGGSTDSRCPTVQSNLAALQALASDGAAAATAAAALYGPEAPFAPVTGSATDAAIVDRLNDLAAGFASWSSLGLPSYPGAVFAGAQGPLGSNDIQTLVTSPVFGAGIDSLTSEARWGLGDVEVGLRLLLIDTPGRQRRLNPGAGMRLALTGGARIGTGQAPDPDRPFDPGTGDGQHDLIGGAHLDLLFGRRFWMTVTGRYTAQLGDRLTMRVATPATPLPLLSTRAEIDRELGDVVELEVSPRLALGRYLAIGVRYAYLDKAEDRHTYATAGDDATRPPAGLLDSATAISVQELGLGFTYSTVAAHGRGLARWPLDVTYQHVETLDASGGYVPNRRRDEVRLRVYLRIFGNRE